jgi:hypothetical protein
MTKQEILDQAKQNFGLVPERMSSMPEELPIRRVALESPAAKNDSRKNDSRKKEVVSKFYFK